jgi:hypothetical protein
MGPADCPAAWASPARLDKLKLILQIVGVLQ